MNLRRDTLSADYFDDLYAADSDPWRFETSPYEKKKYAATMDLLGPQRRGRVLECGCSIGVFTALLAERCEDVLAIDASTRALTRARAHKPLDNVRFERRHVPAEFPDGSFDLILLSEILYYLSPGDLDMLAARCLSALRPDGEIVLCHWLGETDYPLTGQEASDLFAASVAKRLPKRTIAHDDVYRLEHFAPR